MSIIHPRINQNHVVDSLGLFGPILINAIFGGLVLAPGMLHVMYKLGYTFSATVGAITSTDVMNY